MKIILRGKFGLGVSMDKTVNFSGDAEAAFLKLAKPQSYSGLKGKTFAITPLEVEVILRDGKKIIKRQKIEDLDKEYVVQ